ncbi:hypothetical protein F4821DRAFT_227843 [Hypoxylon rubiginosum]|uniref:Uncharacterized protein n=1 Tax=Hypoxylon rubiginosum TaxID=110542 RepID=A0ACC0DE07_9PEZI|nr:hypothetical protein F4821DRAFT_227843 [Hypoxylon rubiginosum]
MEAIGATAAIADLLGLSIKASKAAKSLVQSIIHAPEELVELIAKLDRLHSRIRLLQNLSEVLSVSDSTILFPHEYNTLFSVGLQLNFETLEKIKSLWDPPTGTERHVRKRLRWAALDKKKAAHILQNIKEAESELGFMLNIIETRLASMNQTSLATLATTQAALRLTFEKSVEDIKTVIREEVACLHSSKGATPYHPQSTPALGTKATIIEDESGILIKALEFKENRTLTNYSRTWGSFHNPYTDTGKTTWGTSISFKSKRNRRKFTISLKMKFTFLCVRILQFEMRAQHISRQWLGAPWLGCSMTVFNFRPQDSLIFGACRDRDFWRVRDLFESGEASVYDVDDTYGGLLEHVIYGQVNGYTMRGPELLQAERLVRYLLEQGCNPCAFPDKLKNVRLPAILEAFDNSYFDIISSMESYGADLLQFDSTPARLFDDIFGSGEKFSQKVRKLRSIGFADWNIDGDNILYGASRASNLGEILFALEVVGLSPNEKHFSKWTPTGNAAYNHWLKGVAILIESGADVNAPQDVPLVRSTEHGRMNKTTHYLLYSGADPNLSNSAARNAWHNIWDIAFDLDDYQSQNWSYMQLEGTLAHMLLHNADPFISFVTDLDSIGPYNERRKRWYGPITQIRASEVARAWSYRIEYEDRWYERWLGLLPNSTMDFRPHFEELEETRLLEYATGWSTQGTIYPFSSKSSHHSATEGSNSTCRRLFALESQISHEDGLGE